MLKKHLFTIAFIGWLVFITILSLFSFPEDSIDISIEIPHIDKAVHFIFYFVLAVLGCFFLREIARERIHLIKAIILMVGFALIYGIIIEVIQDKLTTERSGDVLDVLANSVGALTGGVLIKSIFSRKSWLKWKN